MNSAIVAISLFFAIIVFVYILLFLRGTYRLLVDSTIPLHINIRLDDDQMSYIMRKIK